MTATTIYGTWCNRVDELSSSPDDDVTDYVSGGTPEWLELLQASGALARIRSEYREAINAALPDSIALSGDEFIGPSAPEDGEFDGYPVDEDGWLDFKAIVDGIDLEEIRERNEPITLDEIGRDEELLGSKAARPDKAASVAMGRLGLKPHIYLPHPKSGRPQAIYLKGVVKDALARRPANPQEVAR